MSHSFRPGLKLGILGGGQLARMLALSAHHWGIEPWIYSEKSSDPARQVSPYGMTGSLKDEKQIETFLRQVDLCTFESEFLDAELLQRLQKSLNKTILPSPTVMGSLQDRKTQKELLDKHGLPTAPWRVVDNAEQARQAVKELSLPLVFKKRRFGYDGYGTFVVKNQKSLKEFCEKQFPAPEGFIAESFIPFKRELACIFARRPKGQVVHYPLVESFQKDSRCFWVKGPIKHSGFSAWVKKVEKFLQKTQYVGVMGLELFETQKGLLVNELAPRVHNSGHYTQDAFALSQFDLHLLALLDAPLDLSPGASAFAMVNLLGDVKPSTSWTPTAEVVAHWYGKTESRPGRKMGHINALGTTADKALERALKARKRFSI